MIVRPPLPGVGTRQARSLFGDFASTRTSEVLQALREDFRASVSGAAFLRDVVTAAKRDAAAANSRPAPTHNTDGTEPPPVGPDTEPATGPDTGPALDVSHLSPVLSDLAARVYDGLQVEDDEFPRFVELLTLARRTDLLTKYRVNHLSYNIFDDHYANAGMPSTLRPEVRPVAAGRRWEFLGHHIGFPIGVAASGLTTNSVAVGRLLRSGYNVVTYKTVRSRRHDPLAPPNWLLSSDLTTADVANIRPGQRITVELGDTSIASALGNPHVSTANSFGVPSPDPTVWTDDLQATVAACADDQLVICSVLGEDYSDTPHRDRLIADFIDVSTQAWACGVAAIELNLSCPNTLNRDGAPATPLCHDQALAIAIVEAVRTELGPDPKIGVKLSYLPPNEIDTLLDAIGNRIDFVAGINTIQANVHHHNAPAFGDREVGGLGGHVLADLATQFVTTVDNHRRRNNMTYAIIGIGGVTDVHSFERLHKAGADVVQAVSGVFVNTFLALDCVRDLTTVLPVAPTHQLKAQLLQLTRTTPTPLWLYAAAVDQPLSLTVAALNELVTDGLLTKSVTTGDPSFAATTTPAATSTRLRRAQ